MRLIPINDPDLIHLVSGWLSEERNYQWLDFGNGLQPPSPVALKIMVQKDEHVIRVFTDDEDDVPIGIVGLTNIKRDFKTATTWIALGEKQYSMKGYALRSGSAIVTYAFQEMGLNVVDAWAVSCNHASLKIIKRLNFKPIGVQRQCHIIKGRVYDRLWFDLLASEHKEIEQCMTGNSSNKR